jgi:hypothetical protein
MAQCTENIAASCSMRHPLLPVPRAYHVGPDLGLAGGNFEFAVAADFDDLEGYLVCRDNPEHQQSSGSSSSR